MNGIKFSIITALYNQEVNIVRCIESVINQSYTHFEYIIVNDGSTDNSYNIAKSYAQKDNRIKIINQKNQGSTKAYNNGLKQITGTYTIILDNDDWIEKNTLEILNAYIKKHKSPDVIQIGYRLYYEANNYSIVNFGKSDVLFNATNKEKAYAYSEVLITNTRKCIKTILYDSKEYIGNPYGADTILLAKILVDTETILLIPNVLFNVSKGSTSQSKKRKESKEWLEICYLHYNYLTSTDDYNENPILYCSLAIKTTNYFKFYLSSFKIKLLTYNKKISKDISKILPFIIDPHVLRKMRFVCKYPNIYSLLRTIYNFFFRKEIG